MDEPMLLRIPDPPAVSGLSSPRAREAWRALWSRVAPRAGFDPAEHAAPLAIMLASWLEFRRYERNRAGQDIAEQALGRALGMARYLRLADDRNSLSALLEQPEA